MRVDHGDDLNSEPADIVLHVDYVRNPKIRSFAVGVPGAVHKGKIFLIDIVLHVDVLVIIQCDLTECPCAVK